MMLKAKCKKCGWKMKSSHSLSFIVAVRYHQDCTGHVVKIKRKVI